VPITVAQLFLLLGLPYVIITAARALFEAFFYLAMANSMSKVLHEKQPAFSVAVKAVFLLCGFGSLVCVATVYWAPELYVVFAQTVMHVFYILLLCVLGLLFLLMPLAATKAKNSNKRNKKSKKEENVVLNDKLSVSQETEEAIL
jgi:glucan phosphoethanolaminetransferase (alkaline phosphatase superfamily)